MRKVLATFVLFIFGWKTRFPTEYRFPKMLMVAAPYTSNWDFIFTFAAYWKQDIYPEFMFYDSAVKGISNKFLKMIGGIEIKKDLIGKSVNLFNEKNTCTQIIAPEGGLAKVEKWRTGFYQIAKQADVPICLCFLDYKSKTAGIGDMLNMSGNFEKDMSYIENFYKNSNSKHPEKYNNSIY